MSALDRGECNDLRRGIGQLTLGYLDDVIGRKHGLG